MPENMSEDCLHLNVYTPSLNSGRELPVMVWVHGGGNMIGFLFTGTGPDDIHGNMCLLDQIEALRWLQQYIHHFAGDPHNVTVFGESSGSGAASALVVSPLAEGLFHKVICQSGASSLGLYSMSPSDAKVFFDQILQTIGCKGTTTQDIRDFLQNSPIRVVTKAIKTDPPYVVDGRCFPGSHIDLYESGHFHAVKRISGFCANEGLFELKFYDQHNFKAETKEKAMAAVAEDIQRSFPGTPNEIQMKIAAIAENFYLQDCEENTEKLTQAVSDCLGDMICVAPTMQEVKCHAQKATTFVYSFEHRPFFNTDPQWLVAGHFDDIPYVFGEPFLSGSRDSWPEEDRQVSRTVMKYWTNFAKNGDPNEPGMTTWRPFDDHSQAYLSISLTPEEKNRYEPNRMAFWNKTVRDLTTSAKNKA